jgi:hypothetical protein
MTQADEQMLRLAASHIMVTDGIDNACASFIVTDHEIFYGRIRTGITRPSVSVGGRPYGGFGVGECQMLLLMCYSAFLIKDIFHIDENNQFAAARSQASVADTKNLSATCVSVDMLTEYTSPGMVQRFMSVDVFRRMPVTLRNQFDDNLDAARRAAESASQSYRV